MGMTIAEKILAAHSGRARVSPGDLLQVKVDFTMANDITGPMAIREVRNLGVGKVFDPQRVALVMSHFVPSKDIASATNAKTCRQFAQEQGCIFFDAGKGGIEHTVLPAQGYVVPGDVYVGADSHTTTVGALGAFAAGFGSTDTAVAMAMGELWMKVPPTLRFIYHGQPGRWLRSKDLILHTIGQIGTDGALYACMQFEGEAVRALSVEARLTMCNMVAEAGGKAGIVPVDRVTLDYVRPVAKRPYTVYEPDPDASYAATYEFDVSKLEPVVARPWSPGNVVPVREVAREKVEIDQVFIGSCTNARMEDLREAAELMRGRQVHQRVRCIVMPASVAVWNQAMKEGLLEAFADAGCVVSTAGCGPCIGGFMGVLAEGERCVSTSNRNFPGRMGHVKSETYLASPVVAAASAILGRVAHPDEV
ncbi:MAG: 3-isopropylmalate dehydratase large subunit [Chloroflexi bacterium]|nr:3-isopropylmalate dehydratase large subunit [Chloroflexota bacterium]